MSRNMLPVYAFCFFFFNDPATTEIYPLSLHDALPISFTSFSHSTRNKTRDGLIRVRNIRALNGRFNTSITHAYSIVSAIQGSNVPNPDEAVPKIGRAVQQECRDRSRMPSSA